MNRTLSLKKPHNGFHFNKFRIAESIALILVLIMGFLLTRCSREESEAEPTYTADMESGTPQSKPREKAEDSDIVGQSLIPAPRGKAKKSRDAKNTGEISGVIIDTITSSPIQGSLVSLQGEAPVTTPTVNGAFLLENLPSGDYRITGSASGYSTETVRLRLDRDVQLSGIVLRLTPLSSISGTVMDTTNNPVADAEVFVAYGQAWRRRTRRTGPGTVTNAQGFFMIEGIIPDRTFNLIAEHEDYADATKGIFRLRPGQRERGVIIVMERGGTVRGIVQSSEQAPIEDARVRIGRVREEFRMGGRMGNLMAATSSAIETQSDSNGAFEFRNVAAGTYVAFAEKEEYVYGYKEDIVVKSGEITDGIILTLEQGAIFSGVVKNPEDKPVDNAAVQVRRFNFERPLFASQRTGSDGRFKFTTLVPGTYTVEVNAEGYPRLVVSEQAVPEEDVELVLSKGGTLRGKVTDETTGAAVKSFAVRVYGSRGDFGMGMEFGRGPRGASESFDTDDGVFEITGLSEGTYTAMVSSADFIQGTKEGIQIRENEVTEIEVGLSPGFELNGVVLSGIDESPVPNASVSMQESSAGVGFEGFRGRSFGRSIASTRTDALGKFTLTNLAEGDFQIRAEADGYLETTEQISIPLDNDTILTLYLNSGGKITGRVVDAESGQPVMGANVAIPPASGFGRMSTRFAEGARTDSEGRFVLEPVAEGRTSLSITHNDYSSRTLEDIMIYSGQTHDTGDIALTKGGGIEGMVFDADAEPVEGAVIWATGPSGMQMSSTNPEGNYQILSLEPGEYTVSLNYAPESTSFFRDMQRSQKTVTVVEDEMVRADFILEPGYTLSGTVTYRDEPAEGWRVSYKRSDTGTLEGEQVSGTKTVGADGTFEFTELAPGAYAVYAHRRGNISFAPITPVVEEYVEIVDDHVSVTLEIPESNISGKVLDRATGQPISGATVSLIKEGTQFSVEEIIVQRTRTYRRDTTDYTGEFDFNRVDEGTWNLIAQHPNYSYELITETITSGESKERVEFRLQKGLTLKGTASVGSSRIPVLSLFLHVRDATGVVIRSTNVSIDSHGNYILPGFAQGTYRVSAFVPDLAPLMDLTVDMMPDSENRVDLLFFEGGTLDLSTVSGKEQPVKGARVDILLNGEIALFFPPTIEHILNYEQLKYTNDSGKIVHPFIPPGSHIVRISHPDFQPTEETIRINNQEVTRKTIRLEAP